jgi:hypothetical protein
MSTTCVISKASLSGDEIDAIVTSHSGFWTSWSVANGKVMAIEVKSFLPYHEPNIVTILIQSSFILILNVINTVFDRLIFCGLLGQVFIGVAWGTPGAKWLGQEVENVIVQLGYLGLILLVYQGEKNAQECVQTKF